VTQRVELGDEMNNGITGVKTRNCVRFGFTTAASGFSGSELRREGNEQLLGMAPQFRSGRWRNPRFDYSGELIPSLQNRFLVFANEIAKAPLRADCPPWPATASGCYGE